MKKNPSVIDRAYDIPEIRNIFKEVFSYFSNQYYHYLPEKFKKEFKKDIKIKIVHTKDVYPRRTLIRFTHPKIDLQLEYLPTKEFDLLHAKKAYAYYHPEIDGNKLHKLIAVRMLPPPIDKYSILKGWKTIETNLYHELVHLLQDVYDVGTGRKSDWIQDKKDMINKRYEHKAYFESILENLEDFINLVLIHPIDQLTKNEFRNFLTDIFKQFKKHGAKPVLIRELVTDIFRHINKINLEEFSPMQIKKLIKAGVPIGIEQ